MYPPADPHTTRDALAKTLYHRLFLWLIEQVEQITYMQCCKYTAATSVLLQANQKLSKNADPEGKFVGLLDIFGYP